jgi:hypothetical protein
LRNGSRWPSLVMKAESVNPATGFASVAACDVLISIIGIGGSVTGAQPHNPTKTKSQSPQKRDKKRLLEEEVFSHTLIEPVALPCVITYALRMQFLVDRRIPSSG